MTKYPTINYIGNKDKIAEWICDKIPEDVETVFDKARPLPVPSL